MILSLWVHDAEDIDVDEMMDDDIELMMFMMIIIMMMMSMTLYLDIHDITFVDGGGDEMRR